MIAPEIFLDYFYYTSVKNMSEEERTQFDEELYAIRNREEIEAKRREESRRYAELHADVIYVDSSKDEGSA